MIVHGMWFLHTAESKRLHRAREGRDRGNVPGPVLGLPHEGRGGVADTVRDEHDRVHGDALSVAGRHTREPREGENEARGADT